MKKIFVREVVIPYSPITIAPFKLCIPNKSKPIGVCYTDIISGMSDGCYTREYGLNVTFLSETSPKDVESFKEYNCKLFEYGESIEEKYIIFDNCTLTYAAHISGYKLNHCAILGIKCNIDEQSYIV